MKKTIKWIITGILAVSTIATSAFLLAGCGEKSAEDKIRDAYNSYKSSSEQSYDEEETGEKETVELDLIDKIISDRLYTLKFYDDYNGGLYIHIDDTIDIDGYTVELREKTEEYDSYHQPWDIKKDGETLASFEMSRDSYATREINDNNNIAVTIWIDENPCSEETSSVEFKFTETERDNIEIDVPAALTEAECKQHMDELKAAAWDRFKDSLSAYDENDVDIARPKLDGVYYFHGDYDFLGGSNNAEKTFLVFDFSLNLDIPEDTISFAPSNIRGIMVRPFFLDGELTICQSYTESWGFDDEDLAQGTKIG